MLKLFVLFFTAVIVVPKVSGQLTKERINVCFSINGNDEFQSLLDEWAKKIPSPGSDTRNDTLNVVVDIYNYFFNGYYSSSESKTLFYFFQPSLPKVTFNDSIVSTRGLESLIASKKENKIPLFRDSTNLNAIYNFIGHDPKDLALFKGYYDTSSAERYEARLSFIQNNLLFCYTWGHMASTIPFVLVSVSFNKSFTDAEIEIETCASGENAIYTKENNKWKIKKFISGHED